MDFSDDEKIKLHLKQVAEVQRTADKNVLTLQDLKELNLGIGVSEKEWNELLDKAADFLALANSHLSRNNFYDALECAEKAVGLNPFIKGGNSVRANASYHLWLLEQTDQLRYQAEMFAKDALRLDRKDEMALEVLKNLRIKNRFFAGNKKINKLVIIALLIIFIVIGVIVWSGNTSTKKPYKIEKTEFVENHENALITAQEETNVNFAEIKNMYARKNTLIRELLVLSGSGNSTFLGELTELQLALNNDLSPEKYMDYQIRMEENITKLLSEVAEADRTNEKIEFLIIQIEGSQNRITFAKRKYNQSVKTYNLLVKRYGKDFTGFKEKNYLN
ncbi:MAG: LemA family protein [Saprospiraceae bacterium]|nr:LemA family protein [Saprospiraceae bacterium]